MGLERVEKCIETYLEVGTFPGLLLGVVKRDEVLYQGCFGQAQLEPKARPMHGDVVFDLASLTKVMATTTSILQLIERGMMNLWDSLKYYYPHCPQDKEDITLYHLLTHTSGYPAMIRLWDRDLSQGEAIEHILNLPLEYKTGQGFLYSDPNFILLGDLVEKVTGMNLHSYTQEQIFVPLHMHRTAFNPKENLPYSDTTEYATTEWCSWRQQYMEGEVHDENCYALGGISGHAGLFSTLEDVQRFVQMVLGQGTYNGVTLLSRPTLEAMGRNWTKEIEEDRGLGWDLCSNPRSSGGILLSPSSMGHTGFTGTSLWIDPRQNLGIVLLTNRVHPSRENTGIISFRPRIHNLLVSTFAQEG